MPRGTERLRITPTPFHDEMLIDSLRHALVETWDALGIPYGADGRPGRRSLRTASSRCWCRSPAADQRLPDPLRQPVGGFLDVVEAAVEAESEMPLACASPKAMPGARPTSAWSTMSKAACVESFMPSIEKNR